MLMIIFNARARMNLTVVEPFFEIAALSLFSSLPWFLPSSGMPKGTSLDKFTFVEGKKISLYFNKHKCTRYYINMQLCCMTRVGLS